MWGGKKARDKRNSRSSSYSSSNDYEGDGYEIMVTIPEKFKNKYSIWGTFLDYCSGRQTGDYEMELSLEVKINPNNTNYRSADIMRFAKQILSEIPEARKYDISIDLRTEPWD